MTGQLAFDLPVTPALGRDDFFVSDANRSLLAMVDRDNTWPAGRLVLCGPSGSGKTHLATIWIAQTKGRMIAANALGRVDLPDLCRAPAVAVDNADHIAGDPVAEARLFHLCNLLAELRTPLMLTGATSPRDWGISLPDLASRIQASALARLSPPDDGLLSSLMIKLFADRQIGVDPTLVSYLVARMDRTFTAARALVRELDRLSLERAVPITRALAAEALARLTDTRPPETGD